MSEQPSEAITIASADPWASPAPTAVVEPCRPLGDVVPPVFASTPPKLSDAALVDAFGNSDGYITGIENELLATLEKMPLSARCWLGFSATPKTRPGQRLEPSLAIALATDLDCGPGHDGRLGTLRPALFSGHATVVVALSRIADGVWAVGSDVIDTAGVPTRAKVAGPDVVWKSEPPLEFKALRTKLLQLAEDQGADCVASVRAHTQKSEQELAAGRCPIASLSAHNGIGDYHARTPPGANICIRWDVAAYDLLIVRSCALPTTEAGLNERFSLYTGASYGPEYKLDWAADGLSDLLPPYQETDAIRALEVLDAIAKLRALTVDERRWRFATWTRLPLGMREREVDGELDAMDTVSVGGDPRLAIRLLNRGREGDLPKVLNGSGKPARWPRDIFLTQTLAPVCAAALGVVP